MTLRLIGAGMPRTGTMSLKTALERLLGGRCYHMVEFFAHPEHASTWAAAFGGDLPDWTTFLADYAAGVDTPICQFWRPLAAAFPDAPVLLSRRADEDVWYRSMEKTVLAQAREGRAQGLPGWAAALPAEQRSATLEVFERLGSTVFGSFDDPEVIKASYRRRLDEVRAAIPADRLVEWQPGDGWSPLCEALGVPVPDEPFPHENSTADFVARVEASQARPGDGEGVTGPGEPG